MSNGVAHGDLTLFDCPRVRRSEYWQFIKLIAPADASALPAGQTHWLSQDASDAFCLKCQKMFRFLKGSSNSVRRHMERFHKKELLKHQAQAELTAKKAGSIGGSGSTSSNSTGINGGSGLKGKPLKKATKRLQQDVLQHQHDMSLSSSSGEKHGGGSSSNSESTTTGMSSSSSSSLSNKKPRSGSFGSFEQRNAMELLVKWLCRNMRSLSIVEDPGFVDFVEYISGSVHGFALPNHEALSHRLELMAENAKFEIKQRVKKEVAHFALSADVWLPAVQASVKERFVALFCHSLTEDFVMNTWTLEVIPLSAGTEDETEITTRVHAVLRDWGLQKQAPTLFFSDGDEQIERAGQALSLRCFKDIGSSLEQILSQGAGLFISGSSPEQTTSPEIEQQPQDRLGLLETDELPQSYGGSVVSSALAELKAFAEVLSANSAAANKLQQIHSAVGGDFLKLASYATNSWIDVFEFLSRAVLWQTSLDLFFDFITTPEGAKAFEGMTLTKPTARTWYIAEALILILQPFHELKDVVASEKRCSLPFITPCLSVIKKQLGRDDLFTELTLRYRAATSYDDFDALNQLHAFQQLVLTEFLRQYDAICQELQWCSALDPRHGRLRHLSEDERELCKISLVERAMELFVSQLPPAPSDPPLGGLATDFDGDMMYGVGGGRAPVQGLMHRLLYDDDEDVSSSEALSREAEIAQTRLYVENEVQMYMSEHQLRKTRISCPLQWWQANRERYPFLAPVARIWLGTITSCGSESSPSPSASGLKHTIPQELCVDRKSESAGVSWQKTVTDMIFLHTNLRSRSETSISL
ncbi:Long chain acyl-coa synthetase 7 [Globisporangium polare]